MQMLTTEAAQAEIINEDFTSPETVLPLPSFGRNLQRLPQQAFWRWTIQNLPCFSRNFSHLKIPAFPRACFLLRALWRLNSWLASSKCQNSVDSTPPFLPLLFLLLAMMTWIRQPSLSWVQSIRTFCISSKMTFSVEEEHRCWSM